MLSNWSAHSIIVDGVEYKTVDHAYHAAKFDDLAIQSLIIHAQSPLEAKVIAERYSNSKKDWLEKEKIEIMRRLNTFKTEQHKEVRLALLRSKNREIIEDSPYDSFWGTGIDGNGRNELGEIWMEIRSDMLDKLKG